MRPILTRRRQKYDGDEADARFVSARGIAKSCDLAIDAPRHRSERIASRWWMRAADFGDAQVIHFHPEQLELFVARYLPRLERSFTLVTGDLYWSIGAPRFPEAMLRAVLDHPLLIKWFAQNTDYAHPKLVPIPLGLDYHTISRRVLGEATHGWGAALTPVEQEAQLLSIAGSGGAFEDKAPLGFSNWQFALDRGDRRECLLSARSSAMHMQPGFLPREQSWRENARFAFTISPFGVGIDCHRTWEAILLGTVPVIRHSRLDPNYEGLPVLILDDWHEVTLERLAKEQARFAVQTFDFSRATLAYWMARIRNTPLPPPNLMTISQFIASCR